MNALRKHPFRVTGRLFWLGIELLLSALRYVFHCAMVPRESLPHARACWLQYSASRLLRVINARVSLTGSVPARGLLVSNHLSYVDILLFASLTPACFVAKREVKQWPVFGWFARLAGTVFVDRERRFQAPAANSEIESVLSTEVLVVLFPEGTSSDGKSVLPFKSSLLEPAARHRHELTAGCVHYELDDGDPGEEVCYWKDMVLVPHLLNLLGKRQVRAFVRFTSVDSDSADRKVVARQLHAEVARMNGDLRSRQPCASR